MLIISILLSHSLFGASWILLSRASLTYFSRFFWTILTFLISIISDFIISCSVSHPVTSTRYIFPTNPQCHPLLMRVHYFLLCDFSTHIFHFQISCSFASSCCLPCTTLLPACHEKAQCLCQGYCLQLICFYIELLLKL